MKFKMPIHPNTEKANIRIQHIIDSRNNGVNRGIIEQCLKHIENNTGSPAGSLRLLTSYTFASAMACWYESGDLPAFKNLLYNRSRLECILLNKPYEKITSPITAYGHWATGGMSYLLSDDASLIHCYSSLDAKFNSNQTQNTKKQDYWTKQFFLALRGEWDILAERCECIIANPPTTSAEKKLMLDQHFYLALAKGDLGSMEAAIKELVTLKNIGGRVFLENGYSADLICTPAIIYSKIAWRHGYEIVVDSPYIPKEWLPIAPLARYEDAYDFMSAYPVLESFN